MKRIIALALCLILTATAAAAPWTKTQVCDHHKAFVFLRGEFSKPHPFIPSRRKNGSGTIIKVTKTHFFVLSCRHVFKEGEVVFLKFTTGPMFRTGICIKDGGPDADLALIAFEHTWINWKHVFFVPVSDKNLRVGQFVECSGYGKDGDGAGQLRHWLAQVVRYHPTSGAMIMETSVVQGDSGGGVVFGGQLVGVLMGGYKKTHIDGTESDEGMFVHPARAVNVQQIKTFLEGAFPSEEP